MGFTLGRTSPRFNPDLRSLPALSRAPYAGFCTLPDGNVWQPLSGVTITVSGAEEILRMVTDSMGSFSGNPGAKEVGESRVFGGIHFPYANREGLARGVHIARAVLRRHGGIAQQER